MLPLVFNFCCTSGPSTNFVTPFWRFSASILVLCNASICPEAGTLCPGVKPRINHSLFYMSVFTIYTISSFRDQGSVQILSSDTACPTFMYVSFYLHLSKYIDSDHLCYIYSASYPSPEDLSRKVNTQLHNYSRLSLCKRLVQNLLF